MFSNPPPMDSTVLRSARYFSGISGICADAGRALLAIFFSPSTLSMAAPPMPERTPRTGLSGAASQDPLSPPVDVLGVFGSRPSDMSIGSDRVMAWGCAAGSLSSIPSDKSRGSSAVTLATAAGLPSAAVPAFTAVFSSDIKILPAVAELQNIYCNLFNRLNFFPIFHEDLHTDLQ